jgi:ribosomal protein L23
MNLKPIATEKAVMKIESENVLTFVTGLNSTKLEIKKEIEDLFKVKIERVSTQRRSNKKIAYVKLNKKYLAIDVATKLGMM